MLNRVSVRSLLLIPLLLIGVGSFVQSPELAHASPPTWSSPTLIDANSGLNLLSSTLQASNGTLWVAWQSDRNAIQTGRYDVVFKTYTNGVWSSYRNFTTSSQNASPSLLQLTNGTIALFWAQRIGHSYEILYSQYSTRGWSTALQITNTSLNDTQPSVAVGLDGAVWLVWTRVNSTNTQVPSIKQLYYKTWKNGVWSTDTQLTTDSNQNYGSSVMVGKDGIVRVTWSKGPAGSTHLLYEKTFNGTTWTPDTLLVSSASTDEHPSMIQDRNGTLWLFWGRLIVVSSTVQYYALFDQYSYDMGSTWSTPVQLTNTSTSVDSFMPSAVQSTYSTKPIWIFYSTNLNEPTYDIFALISSGIQNVHNVALSGAYASSSLGNSWEYPGGFQAVGLSAIVTITVTISNPGDFSQTVFVNLTATNTTSIFLGTKSGFVGPGASVNIYFYWNTNGVKPDRYGFTASVAPVTGETYGNSFDNMVKLSNQMHILPVGDVDQDGSVTITDVVIFYVNFNLSSSCNCSQWNPYADIQDTGTINIVDVTVASGNFNTFT